MMHKGVEYMVAPTATPGIWKWQFRIGDQVKTGRTETRINLLAMRRVELRIDRELRKPKRSRRRAAAVRNLSQPLGKRSQACRGHNTAPPRRWFSLGSKVANA
jgi:hypothetical protein